MKHILNKGPTVIGKALYNSRTHPDLKCREVTKEIRKKNHKPYKETLLSVQERNQAY